MSEPKTIALHILPPEDHLPALRSPADWELSGRCEWRAIGDAAERVARSGADREAHARLLAELDALDEAVALVRGGSLVTIEDRGTGADAPDAARVIAMAARATAAVGADAMTLKPLGRLATRVVALLGGETVEEAA